MIRSRAVACTSAITPSIMDVWPVLPPSSSFPFNPISILHSVGTESVPAVHVPSMVTVYAVPELVGKTTSSFADGTTPFSQWPDVCHEPDMTPPLDFQLRVAPEDDA